MVEGFICVSPTLSRLDDELAALHKRTLAGAPSAVAQELRAKQRAWLRAERDPCDTLACAGRAMAQRSDALRTALEFGGTNTKDIPQTVESIATLDRLLVAESQSQGSGAAHPEPAGASPVALPLAHQPTTASSPHAQVEAQVAKAIAASLHDDARHEAALDRAYGSALSAEKRKVVKVRTLALMNHERMPGYLASVIAPVASPALTAKDVQAYMFEGLLVLQLRGLRRLPTERKVQFLQYTVDMTAALPAQTCKALFLGKLDSRAANQVELQYNATMPLHEFEAINMLQQEAGLAELVGFPDVKTLSATQAQAAERAHELAVAARIRRMPAGLSDRVMRNFEAAQPTEACLWFREVTSAALDLTEPYRSWYMIRFTESLE